MCQNKNRNKDERLFVLWQTNQAPLIKYCFIRHSLVQEEHIRDQPQISFSSWHLNRANYLANYAFYETNLTFEKRGFKFKDSLKFEMMAFRPLSRSQCMKWNLLISQNGQSLVSVLEKFGLM